MYNTTSNPKKSAKQAGYIIEKLTDKERKALSEKTIGYGAFRAFARIVDIHENTLRAIMWKGSGKPETIKKVRKALAA